MAAASTLISTPQYTPKLLVCWSGTGKHNKSRILKKKKKKIGVWTNISPKKENALVGMTRSPPSQLGSPQEFLMGTEYVDMHW